MNKKVLFFLAFFFCFLTNNIFSQRFKIYDATFDIKGAGFNFLGKTTPYSLQTNFPLDKKKVFDSEDEFKEYLDNYKVSLDSSRFFESVELDYEILDIQNENSENSDIQQVILHFDIKDSHHLLFVPYPKFSSNTGFSFKLKGKDTNFLGSLQTLSTELRLDITNEGFEPGFAIDISFPFKIGIFDAQWVNDYEIYYTINNPMPEWNAKTGLKLTLPFYKNSILLEFYQYSYKNFDYLDFNDDLYFKEEFAFSFPISIFSFDNFTELYFTPKISFYTNWDFNGINIQNSDLSSPSINFSSSFSNKKISWDNFFRLGYYANFNSSILYNFQRNDISPSLSAEIQLFYNFSTSSKRNFLEKFGICTDIYYFSYFYLPNNEYLYGEKIGSRIRGILDNSYFGNDLPNAPMYTASSAIIFNLDLPHHLFTTNFKYQIMNFNFQVSPFVDIALVLDRKTNTLFSLKDGFYTAGLEFLVYPLKWSSYTLRASVGFDVLKVLKSDSKFKGLLKYNEIFIGIGLHY